jgi:citrate lyase subunit beta/citryl-CoA lyase|uniref:CoA ester lyase n=1 Tax=candidate division CPR3 bacterium TaxID=2268181 RepID=A0A7V3JAG4_UNCC3
MPITAIDPLLLVRRSKLFVPVNREKFVIKAWTRGADCIILDLEDSIPPSEKDSARKMIRDAIPVVKRGGAEIIVRINREFEEEDLDAAVCLELTGVMIPKCESAEEIQRLDEMVSKLEREREIIEGKIQFDLIIETAPGITHMESIALSSSRVVQMSIGAVDLSCDMGYVRSEELNFDQFFYPASKLLFAARAAKVQACGLWPQNKVDFTNISASHEDMVQACRRSYMMGYFGTSTIHPAWIEPINEGFKPSSREVELARKMKDALEEAYRQGRGSVAFDGRMIDVANLKHVNNILRRAEAIAKREEEKAKAMAEARGYS